MALIDLTKFEQYIGSYIPFVGNAIDFQRERETQKALVQLYDEADAVTVLLVKFVAAVVWWATHIGSATADALGYSQQIRAALAKADADTLEAWTQWLNVKYPADLRALYNDLAKQITGVQKSIPKQHKVNLKPIEAEIAALEKWKRLTVTPELKQWLTFYNAWKRTYSKPVHTLIGWLKTPSALANFVALPLISVLPSELRKPAAVKHAASIESALVATWANDSNAIYDSILEWLVT